MPTIFEQKEQELTETPLLLFECALADGSTERWSTHAVMVDGKAYAARVLRHNLLEMQSASDQGVDGAPRLSVTLANADSHFSQIERNCGWKGARLTARFAFYDLRAGQPATESAVVFQGICSAPAEITEAAFRLSATNRMSLQRVPLPPVRIQRRCPWYFPATAEEREEALNGDGYGRFYRCGYSADRPGGSGALDGTEPFTTCGYTRAECEARGMFREARRFGGLEFVPPSIQVRGYGEAGWHAAAVADNRARYNDFVPLVYGTAWYAPPVVFARNDGNLTRMEVLLGMGEMEGVLKVLVNDIEIPMGVAGANMSATGWFNLVSAGARAGAFNPDFSDSAGQPAGDPYGSMAYLSVVVPNRISDGRGLPDVQVLAQGMKLPVYGSDGSPAGTVFTNNPAWVLLDVLRRCGWAEGEIDAASFARAAACCGEALAAGDLYGNPVSIPRFACNLVLQKRRSAGDVIRGIRNAARLLLTYGSAGLLAARVENTLALEQADRPGGSNATETLDGGWPAYEFGDGTGGTSGILRRDNGEPSVRLWSRSSADTPNRLTVEFQDALNEYQQDSFSMVDVGDAAAANQETATALSALGIANYHQAARLLRFNLDRSIRGNTYIEFESSVKALGLRPGDLIAVTYLKEGFERQPFRVIRIAPGTNYRTATITAQIHRDEWYSDSSSLGATASGRQPKEGNGMPRALVGTTSDENGLVQFGISEESVEATDGSEIVELTVEFLAPPAPEPGGPGIPLLSLAAEVGDSGAFAGAQVLYYAVSALDSLGRESGLSFLVRAVIPEGSSDRSVTLTGLSFSPGTAGFNVYRGPNPSQLMRIASAEAVAPQFTDAGMSVEPLPPADANYDHANFYWRRELVPEVSVTIHGAATVGSGGLQMGVNAYRGAAVRITRGRGAGQERAVATNTTDTLSLASKWDVEPDATSWFVVSESGWRAGASGRTSPVRFQIPDRSGEVVEVCGRAANINDAECPLELSPVTRWVIGGAAGGGLPPAPTFALSRAGGGRLVLSAVAFAGLENTATITSGTLRLHYWDELAAPSSSSLAEANGGSDAWLTLSEAGPAQPGDLIQIEGEILRVEEVAAGGIQYRVSRGEHYSTAAAHAEGTAVYHLGERVVVVPFPRNFFGSPYCGEWGYPVLLPNARIASAELTVANNRGGSPAAVACFSGEAENGLRTYSGGQFSFQVFGFLAVDAEPAPDLMVDSACAVRDLRAVLKRAPQGSAAAMALLRNGTEYATLQIPDGATVSGVVNGFGLPPLAAQDRLALAITAVGADLPGADLTVTIRL